MGDDLEHPCVICDVITDDSVCCTTHDVHVCFECFSHLCPANNRVCDIPWDAIIVDKLRIMEVDLR